MPAGCLVPAARHVETVGQATACQVPGLRQLLRPPPPTSVGRPHDHGVADTPEVPTDRHAHPSAGARQDVQATLLADGHAPGELGTGDGGRQRVRWQVRDGRPAVTAANPVVAPQPTSATTAMTPSPGRAPAVFRSRWGEALPPGPNGSTTTYVCRWSTTQSNSTASGIATCYEPSWNPSPVRPPRSAT